MKELFANPDNFHEILCQANLDSSSEPITITLAPGIYRGQYTVTRNHLSLIGSDASITLFTQSLAANEILDDGLRRGTFRTQSFFVDADYFKAVGLSFSNEAGPGEVADQALAMYSDGDHIEYDHCRFLGNQDTLFTAPLPPNELQSGGFRGPKEFAPRRSGRQLFQDCYIEGTVDFIFGGAVSVFENCEIFSKLRPEGKCGYVTAPSTPEAQDYGYVFHNCKFTGDALPGSVYLGRPWRNFAHVAVLNCYLGEQIHPEHWHDWKKPEAHETIQFYEFENYGPGATDVLPEFAHFLTEEEARHYDTDKVFAGEL